MLIDTHCHIHEDNYQLDINHVVKRAVSAQVSHIICVGTDLKSSTRAIEASKANESISATAGMHPHDTKHGWSGVIDLINLQHDYLAAIGEIGLDYYYNHSPRDVQIKALSEQIQIALRYDLPIIFHVREAFDDFWAVFSQFTGIRGVLHSFTDNQINVDKALAEGLYIGVNGISTFTRDEGQQEVFNNIPLERMLLETDSPFLTPVPFRGKVNEPAFVRDIAKYHAYARDQSLQHVANITTSNARALFALS